ncbi:uncharacterized protein LOC130623245 [Hydractinia symbiolongicarpus]|uniref:uncharacterized protein LOC130623245 n=1 Tax=Hydractinia symbiolongicarpus TaxID=13093 RepID=UPI00254E42F0|nr:uncharacterized protein LOC130623245 [Hydractinia symbiolongicarpus]
MADSVSKKGKHKKPSLGKQCAAWGCDSRGLVEFEGERITSALSFFQFPKDPSLRKVWCNRIKRVDGKDNFRVTNYTVLCEKHFEKSDIIRPPGGTLRKLKKGAKPMLFEAMVEQQGSKRKPPVNRPSPRKKFRNTVSDYEPPTESFMIDMPDVSCDMSSQTEESFFDSQSKIEALQKENEQLKNNLLHRTVTTKCKFVEHVLLSDGACNHYTGLPNVKVFKGILIFLNTGDNGENVVLYNNQQVKGDSQRGRPRMLSPLESFLLTLVRIRRNFDIFHLSYIFQVSEATVTNTVLTWINYMYVKFGSICIWPTRQQVKDVMPKSMMEKFPNVRCIIDCVEFKIAVPASLVVHKLMYSDYKSHTTVKVLVGIAPGGGFTFISSAFPGSISDKNIVVKSGILYPELWEPGDAIMADRGFLIAEYVNPIGVELIIPCFLRGRDQFSESEVIQSQQIAAERIHVERMIQRLKTFHIFDRVIPVNMLGSLNQIITVCAMLANFQEPILKLIFVVMLQTRKNQSLQKISL